MCGKWSRHPDETTEAVESVGKLRPAACCLVSERHTQNVDVRGEKASGELSVTTSSRRFREDNYQGQKGPAHQGEERKCSRKGRGVVFGCNKAAST